MNGLIGLLVLVADKCFVFRKGAYKYVDHNWKSFDTVEDQPHHYACKWRRCKSCGQIRRNYDS